MFDTNPQTMTCPHCHAVMSTNIEKETASSVHFAACLLCIVFFPLAWLPYYMNERKVSHYCSECNAPHGSSIPPDTMCYSSNEPSCCIPMFNCFSCSSDCCVPKYNYNDPGVIADTTEDNIGSNGGSEPIGCFPCFDCSGCPDCTGCDVCGDCDCGGCDCGDCGGCDF